MSVELIEFARRSGGIAAKCRSFSAPGGSGQLGKESSVPFGEGLVLLRRLPRNCADHRANFASYSCHARCLLGGLPLLVLLALLALLSASAAGSLVLLFGLGVLLKNAFQLGLEENGLGQPLQFLQFVGLVQGQGRVLCLPAPWHARWPHDPSHHRDLVALRGHLQDGGIEIALSAGILDLLQFSLIAQIPGGPPRGLLAFTVTVAQVGMRISSALGRPGFRQVRMQALEQGCRR